MKKLLLLAPLMFGAVLAKEEVQTLTQHQETLVVMKDPRKNYRAKLAKQYFGHSKCRKWNRFCGR